MTSARAWITVTCEPLLATSLLFALLLAGPLSGQAVHKSEVAGALILMAGVTALSVVRSVRSAQLYVGSSAYWPGTPDRDKRRAGVRDRRRAHPAHSLHVSPGTIAL